MIGTKSVHSTIERTNDGLRILVARGRGRGLPAGRYDVWMANLGPSEDLRNSFLAGKISWPEFARRYQKELYRSDSSDAANRLIKNHGQKFTLRLLQHLGKQQNLTLLCHCSEDEEHCHRHILKKVLDKPIK